VFVGSMVGHFLCLYVLFVVFKFSVWLVFVVFVLGHILVWDRGFFHLFLNRAIALGCFKQ
jgi:hypothetical protein